MSNDEIVHYSFILSMSFGALQYLLSLSRDRCFTDKHYAIMIVINNNAHPDRERKGVRVGPIAGQTLAVS